MYGLLWRILPGPVWVRLLLATALVAVAVLACCCVVFPAVDDLLFVPDAPLTP